MSVHRGRPVNHQIGSPYEVSVALFPINGIETIVDWMYTKIPVRFPRLKIAMSEGGVSWVPMVIERLARAYAQRGASMVWTTADGDPVEILHRNFWFTSIEDPSAFQLLDLIGADKVMVEVDFPHGDTNWPRSQALFRAETEHLSDEFIKMVCYGNAASLYRHEPPPDEMLRRSVVGSR